MQAHNLAIVIPAYKEEFFAKTLQSLAAQTSKAFTVYIGDDCSPHNLAQICDAYMNTLDIKYHHFDNNIGAKNLVNQWKRCVDLVNDEEWIWLFADDDIADNNCVEIFNKTIAEDNKQFDVYRFNTNVIDATGKIIEHCPLSPFAEASFDLATEILKFNRGNSIVEHIFSKSVYKKYNGFVYTDYAQGADWATSILFSTRTGICTMPGAKVNWRLAGNNVSTKAAYINESIKGHFQFCNWLINHFKDLKTTAYKKYKSLEKGIDANLQYVIKNHYKGLYFFMYKDVYAYYAENNNFFTALFFTARLYTIIRLPKLFAVK